jgi:hypothetical protein
MCPAWNWFCIEASFVLAPSACIPSSRARMKNRYILTWSWLDCNTKFSTSTMVDILVYTVILGYSCSTRESTAVDLNLHLLADTPSRRSLKPWETPLAEFIFVHIQILKSLFYTEICTGFYVPNPVSYLCVAGGARKCLFFEGDHSNIYKKYR